MTVQHKMDSDPTHNMKRRVENGYEIVSIHYHKDWLYLLKVISSGNNEAYRIALAELCGYPAEEWIRIKEVVLNKQDNGDYIVDVWFRNPGKQFEEYVRMNKHNVDGLIDLPIGISKDVLDWLLEH